MSKKMKFAEALAKMEMFDYIYFDEGSTYSNNYLTMSTTGNVEWDDVEMGASGVAVLSKSLMHQDVLLQKRKKYYFTTNGSPLMHHVLAYDTKSAKEHVEKRLLTSDETLKEIYVPLSLQELE